MIIKYLLILSILPLLVKSVGKFKRVLDFLDPDLSSYYLKVDQKEGINSAIECSALVHITWSSSAAKTKCNAFRQQGTTCEIGRVSPFYTFLEGNHTLPKGTNSGHVLSGCSGNYKNIPQDLFGYWHLSDDLTLFGKYGTFKAATKPDPINLNKYAFIPNSPVPSFTGKWGLKFDGTISTVLMYVTDGPINDLKSFSVLFWYYSTGQTGWDGLFSFSQGNSDGSATDHTGFGLYVDNTNQKLTFNFFRPGSTLPAIYSTSPGTFQGLAWQYFGIIYDYDKGNLWYYLNGNQTGQTINVGQNSFHTNLDRIQFGNFAGTATKNGMASFEFYLRPLSQLEIIAAMARSRTYPINPNCKTD